MIIYNVTVNLHDSIHEDWLNWNKEIYIPQMLQKGGFDKARMVKVIAEHDSGNTYSLQFEAKDEHSLNQFKQNHASEFDALALSKFGELMLTFKTELEFIGDFK